MANLEGNEFKAEELGDLVQSVIKGGTLNPRGNAKSRERHPKCSGATLSSKFCEQGIFVVTHRLILRWTSTRTRRTGQKQGQGNTCERVFLTPGYFPLGLLVYRSRFRSRIVIRRLCAGGSGTPALGALDNSSLASKKAKERRALAQTRVSVNQRPPCVGSAKQRPPDLPYVRSVTNQSAVFLWLGNRVELGTIYDELAFFYGTFCQVRGHSCCSQCAGGSDNSRTGRTSLYCRAQITSGPGFSRKCNVGSCAADPLQ